MMKDPIVGCLHTDTFNIKKLRNVNILVKVGMEMLNKKLIKTTKLNLNLDNAIPIEVSPLYTLHTKIRFIRCPDIKDCTNEEILQGLK